MNLSAMCMCVGFAGFVSRHRFDKKSGSRMMRQRNLFRENESTVYSSTTSVCESLFLSLFREKLCEKEKGCVCKVGMRHACMYEMCDG